MDPFKNITKKTKGINRKTSSRTQVFRNALYTYGKKAGTIKVLPGVKNTGVGQYLTNSRRKVYPLARAIGTFEAAKSGNIIGQLIGRGSRVLSGSISGRLIDMAVRPLPVGQLGGRFLRVQLGKQFNRETKFERVVRDTLEVTFKAKVKITGAPANEAVKRNPQVHKEAQRLLTRMSARVRAYAPDVSTGQYMVGQEDARTKTGRKLINESTMMDQEKFNAMGIKNYQSKGKYVYRDIFGFEKPGEARSYLLASIEQDNVYSSRNSADNFFYYGEINVGGSPLFPWIHAVEYGGKLPYYKREGNEYQRLKKGGRLQKTHGYRQHLNDAYVQANGLGSIKENKGAGAFTYVPDFRYVPPTFFIYRAAADTLKMWKTQTEFTYLGDIDKANQRYFSQYQAMAKKRGGMDNFFKNETSFTRPSNTKNTMEALYRMDKESSRQASFWSRMEQKIPGPRVDMAHGNFYSKELAGAIGLEHIPEEFNFRFNVMDISKDGGEPHSATFLAELARTYISTGGSKDNVITAMAKKIEFGTARGNYFRKSKMRTLNTETNLQRYLAGGGKKGTKLGDTVMRYPKQARAEAERLYGYFAANEKSLHGNMTRKNARTREYLTKMYEIKVRREGNKRIVYTKLKQSKGSKKQTSVEPSNFDKISRSFLSEVELDQIFRETDSLGF